MAGPNSKKRNHQDVGSKSKPQRPKKKQKKAQYHSDSDEEAANPDFHPVNLLDSDDDLDLDNAAVDDVGSLSGSDSELDSAASGSDLKLGDDNADAAPQSKRAAPRRKSPAKTKKAPRDDKSGSGGAAEGPDGESVDDREGEEEEDEEEEEDDYDDDDASAAARAKSKSKRNDPDAFATSMTKILSTKLSSVRRADPVLARSRAAQRAAQAAVDAALETKARRHLREQKRLAQEKGRVRDVLGGDGGEAAAPATESAQQTERRLRKVAHRGVVVLFRAVREAQERAAAADRQARRDGAVGVDGRRHKASEMSRQGFLDLIAAGGGKLKKGGLEEA
ncbi:Rrp15p-domain-containing protein [Durotheca rogersii]|uniref:Rrp15p-domain-containing protein n=1 Tax=Durotheca rogersii TaxID=419775 RepID=UPI0022205A56|nr:Rrp15p-domain-containing protein [Durotheca rogersii]KAI5857441.1 Rrp15p-domain-containing protein [Durotheca rogersii]